MDETEVKCPHCGKETIVRYSDDERGKKVLVTCSHCKKRLSTKIPANNGWITLLKGMLLIGVFFIFGLSLVPSSGPTDAGSSVETNPDSAYANPVLTPQEQCTLQGNSWCNNKCYLQCHSGEVLGDDCVCHKKCGDTYCSGAATCCNNNCYGQCPAGQRFDCPATGNPNCIVKLNLEDIEKSIVHIRYDVTGCCDTSEQLSSKLGGSGSGVIFYKDGSTVGVLTSRHVIDCVFSGSCVYPKSEKITIRTYDGNFYTPSKIWYISKNLDLAILEFQTTDAGIIKATLSSENYSVGDKVTAIGYPAFGVQSSEPILEFSVTEGGITNIYNLLTYRGLSFKGIQSDALTTHGASGGGLFNQDGRLIGIITWGDREQRITLGIDTKVLYDLNKAKENFVSCESGNYNLLEGGCCPYGTISSEVDGKCYVPCGKPNSYCPPPSNCCNNQCLATTISGFVLGEDCQYHQTCGGSTTYCKTGTCCNDKCISCPSGYYLAVNCNCYPY